MADMELSSRDSYRMRTKHCRRMNLLRPTYTTEGHKKAAENFLGSFPLIKQVKHLLLSHIKQLLLLAEINR